MYLHTYIYVYMYIYTYVCPLIAWNNIYSYTCEGRRGVASAVRMPVAAAVNELVGRVLDGLDAGVRARCNRAGILFALDDLGCASTLADLREMLALRLRVGARRRARWRRASGR